MQDTTQARMNGLMLGQDPTSAAPMCPYTHDELDLRTAWLDGFSDGRALLNDPEALRGQPPVTIGRQTTS